MSTEKTAYIFPGQGAQYIGMGKELYEASPRAKAIFDQADDIVGFPLTKICFEGPLEKLTQSAICQPAIVTLSIAAFEVLKNDPALTYIKPSACAGLSLGEYSALVACGSMSFADAVMLVHKRGRFMDEASQKNPGTMVCVLGLEPDKMKAVCQSSGAEIANLNCPGQIVLSGSREATAKAAELAQQAGAKRVIPLEVSGPFHSSLMQPAVEKLSIELAKIPIRKPQTLFVPNVTAEFTADELSIRKLLVQQVAHTTYWEKSIRLLQQNGFTRYYEIGPGKVLRGLLQRIDKQLVVVNVEKWADIVQLKTNAGGTI
jgi:[acyl-carrier-protein] S-malonyltransferase